MGAIREGKVGSWNKDNYNSSNLDGAAGHEHHIFYFLQLLGWLRLLRLLGYVVDLLTKISYDLKPSQQPSSNAFKRHSKFRETDRHELKKNDNISSSLIHLTSYHQLNT